MNILPRSFYLESPEIVAKKLLGKYLVRKIGYEMLVGKIVETEAYLSEGDKAAHGFRGKDARNASLYLSGGHAYVHQMRHHYLLDIVTQEEGVPSSVLIRAIEPIEGIETMKKFRKTDVERNIGNGPGKVGQAFGIDKTFEGIDITDSSSSLFIATGDTISLEDIASSPRIGISKATEKLLRFWIKGNPNVSR
jgi:DNA-3-methyladenine glycosylase